MELTDDERTWLHWVFPELDGAETTRVVSVLIAFLRAAYNEQAALHARVESQGLALRSNSYEAAH